MNYKKQDFGIDKSIDHLILFLQTYRQKQSTYKSYPLGVFIDDMIYGLGTSLDDKFKYYKGFTAFKKELVEYLKKS